MTSPYLLPLLLAGLVSQAATADPLYKWVDKEGRVTYSSTPPPGNARFETVKAPPTPTGEEIRQAEERARKTEEQASELEAQRREQEAKEAEEARLRESQRPPRTIVIEQPVYVPQPVYYPPAMRPRPPRPPTKPPPRPPAGPDPRPLPR